jgi:uncharacterized protein YciI
MAFAVMYAYSPDVALQDATRPRASRTFAPLVDDGALVASGPWGPGDARGGLLVFHASDRVAVQAIVDSDPFVVQGVVARCDIREWVPLLGPAASLLASQR